MREDLLRHIWSKQLFDTSRLAATDGRAVHVFDPGILSRTSGPDFRGAKVRIGEITYTGDIEFHRTCEEWNLHHHRNDPGYNGVILHVVLSGKASFTPSHSGRIIPTVVLEPFLISSIAGYEDQLSREEYSSRHAGIKCSSVNETIDAAIVNDWLRTVYRERLQEKVLRLYERLRSIVHAQHRSLREPAPAYNDLVEDIPLPDVKIEHRHVKQKIVWEQLLYEGVMDGLGYSNNREPMKRLAENVSLMQLLNLCHSGDSQMNGSSATQHIESPGASPPPEKTESRRAAVTEFSPLQLEAILFRASGLLPLINDVGDQNSKVHIHSLNTAWNDLPMKIPLMPLHRTEWIFSPARPSNFPTIRIAAASVILQRVVHRSLFRSIITIVGGPFSSSRSKIEQLVKLFDAGEHPFWNYHFSFSEATHKRHAVLGNSRILDIIVNTIIPFVCLYAKVFGREDIFDRSAGMAMELPLLEDNVILRTMEKHLIRGKLKIEHAFQQQGLIQLNKRYCRVERCRECDIGKYAFKS